jgi:hypothetical protein
MQAAGLRDPEDYDDDDYDNDYADFEYDFEFNPATSSSVMNAAAAFDALNRGGSSGSDKQQQQQPDLQQQLDADTLSAHHRYWTTGSSAGSDRLAALDSRSLGAVLGAIGSLGGANSGAYGLASPGSSHSSGSHMLQGSYQGSFAAAAAAAAAGSSSSVGYGYQQQQRGGGVGTGAAAVVAAAAAGVGAHREVKCV